MEPRHYPSMSQSERVRVRAAYVVAQDSRCKHCGAALGGDPPESILSKPINWGLFPRGRGFLSYPIHLHHNHKTGMTIGAVHARCNAVLWQYHGE